MAIAKKTLYILSGIIKTIVGGFTLLVCALIVLLRGLLKSSFDANPESVQEMISSLVESSEDYAYLSSYTHDEAVKFILDTATIFGVVMGILAIIWIVIAIFQFVNSKKIDKFEYRKKQFIILTVASWVVSPLFISTILTTVGTCLRKKRNAEVYEEIESYQD